MNEDKYYDDEIVKEVWYYVKDAIEGMIHITVSGIKTGQFISENYKMLEYYGNAPDLKTFKERFDRTCIKIFHKYVKLNPDLDVSVSLIFSLHDFDIEDFLRKEAVVGLIMEEIANKGINGTENPQ